jgi:hypothetical protein
VVTLRRENIGVQQYMHSIVLEAFRGPRPSPSHEGCHDNGNPSDNALSNLRWDTRSGNMLDIVKHGRHHHANRECCPRSHSLVAPNLVTSELPNRGCLACSRARAVIHYAIRMGRPAPDLQELSDEYYRKIMTA